MNGHSRTLVVEIGAAAAVRLNRNGEAWGLPTIGIYEDAAEVSLIPAEEDTEGAVHNAEAGQQWPPSAELRATLSGWHRIKFQQGENGGTIATATFEGAKLRRPADAATNQGTRWSWLEPRDANEARQAARNLARYFLMGLTNGSPLADGLRERQDEHKEDVYPELSQLALDSEVLLSALTDAPDELSSIDWEDIEAIGARALQLLAKPA